MIEDFGHVKQNREEMEMLFTWLVHRYERVSVLLTSNLPFSIAMFLGTTLVIISLIARLWHEILNFYSK